MMTPEQRAELEQEGKANQARQRRQQSVRDLDAGEFTIELVRSPDDPRVGEPSFQEELRRFVMALRDAGVTHHQLILTMDAVDARSIPLPEFLLVMKTLGAPAITAVAGYIMAWIKGRMGRKLRVRIGEFEAEARTMPEIEELLRKAAEFHDARERTADSKQTRADTNVIVDP